MTARVMMDLETLATDNDAMIISIGAVFFDEQLGLGREFYSVVNQHLQVEKWGRHRDPRTEKWWSEQSEAAKIVLTESLPEAYAPLLDQALMKFTEYLGGSPVEMWGIGADFDCVILGNAYQACTLARPWSYSKNRCFRTLKNLGINLGAGEGTDRNNFLAHNALEDAKYQAHYAVAYLRRLKAAKVGENPTK